MRLISVLLKMRTDTVRLCSSHCSRLRLLSRPVATFGCVPGNVTGTLPCVEGIDVITVIDALHVNGSLLSRRYRATMHIELVGRLHNGFYYRSFTVMLS